jgi:PAS domain S-box-containing protein
MASAYDDLLREELIRLPEATVGCGTKVPGSAAQGKAIEEALRQSEERFRKLTAAAFEGIGINEGGKVVDVNDQLAQMFGYGREELLGQDVLGLVAPESRALAANAIATGREEPYELLALRKDGTFFEAEVRAKTTLWDGRRVRMTAVRDITERKRASEALQQQLAFDDVLNRVLGGFATCAAPAVDAAVVGALQAIAEFIGADHAYVVIISADRTAWSATYEWCGPNVPGQRGKYQNVPFGTKSWNETLILAAETIRLNTLADYPPEAELERKRDEADGVLSVLTVPIQGSGGNVNGCVCLRTHASPKTWCDSDGVRLKMVGDAIAGVLERKRAEEALRESEERYRAVVEFSPECVAVSVEDHLVYVNPAGARMVGLEEPEDRAKLIGRCVYDFVPEAQHARVRENLSEVVQRGVAAPLIEGKLLRNDGSFVRGEVYNVPFVYAGRPAILSLIRDITERKRTEDALREVSHRLHRAQDEERRRIARDLHDSTAQQLAAVMMNLGVLQDRIDLSDHKSVKLLQESLGLVDRCSEEVRTLSYLLHPPLLDQIGLDAALRLYIEGFSKRSNITITIELARSEERLPEEIELTLFRVVQEALGNIHRHSGSPTAVIRLVRKRAEAVLEVVDSGSGMPPETLRAIQQGLVTQGVGLAGMRERLREVKGRLEIESRPTGTRLRATVPLAGIKP